MSSPKSARDPNVAKADSKYLKLTRSGPRLQKLAVIPSDLAHANGFVIEVPNYRDVTDSYPSSKKKIEVTDGILVFPDNTKTNTFVMNDVIVSYSKYIGKSRSVRTAAAPYNYEYGVDIVTLGIPVAVFNWMFNSIKDTGTVNVSEQDYLHEGDYVWIRNCKLNDKFEPRAISNKGSNEELRFESISNILQIFKKSLIGCAVFSLKIRRTSDKGQKAGTFVLAPRLIDFMMTNKSDLVAPDITNTAGLTSITAYADEDFFEELRKTAEEEEDEDEDNSEEEGETKIDNERKAE